MRTGWPRPSRPLSLALACAAAITLGCATTSANPFEGGGADTQTIRIGVENQQFNEARLTALRPSGRLRIGTVGGNQRAAFTIPWSGDNQLRIEIDLLAGQTHVTRSIFVQPGEEVGLFITNPLYRSYLRR